MIFHARLFTFAITIGLSSAGYSADILDFPKAEKKPIIESWFGIDLQDDYPWLQNTDDPAVKAFATEQNERTRKYLDPQSKPGNVLKTSINSSSPVEHTFFKATDGTQIPLFIQRPRPDTLTGAAVIEIGSTPSSVAMHLVTQGITSCVADLSNRANPSEDLAAIVRFLIEKKFIQPDRLALIGNSTNGAIVGLTITQFPSLFRAAVFNGDLFDLLQDGFNKLPTRSEFNDRLARSPYRRISDGSKYPAILLISTDNITSPAYVQSLKMIARLQKATASPHPTLLRISSEKVNSEDEDIARFLLKELGQSF